MGNVLGITCCTFNLAEFSLANIAAHSCTCLRRPSFPSLQKDCRRLIAAKKEVQDKIALQERQEMTMLPTVDEWLQQVETIQTIFPKLEADYDVQLSANKCFSPTTSYTFGKNVANVRKEVLSLLERKPVEVAQPLITRRPAERPVEQSIGMHSMFDEAWSYMEGETVGIFALQGMGGVGKTTLMKELHNKSNQTFDVVLWIVVSSTLSLSKVQNDIGSFIGFESDKWRNKSEDDKAVDIYNILKQKKYALFLDDVWQRIDLIKLGVPRPDRTNKSKIVLSTRSREVCGNMRVNHKIEVTCLKEEEAWNLFREMVGENTINADPEIQEIAKRVAEECAGLPLALVVIGRAMASRTTLRAWNNALNQLRKNYSTKITGKGEQFLPQLKFSYDSLSGDSIRSCFLYCSLYPEDYLIRKEDIIDKWICEGFLDRFVDLHEARDEGYEYIDTLVNASLLEESSPENFKMHDIIREMAIWISCECGEKKNKFFVRAGVGLTETPNLGECEASERMSLMNNRMEKLNGKPDCPNLVTLFIDNNKLKHIDNEFFQSMGKLRVLDLSYNDDLKEIPKEVYNLVTLQYLNLINLTYLTISKLPINLRNLINLKCFLMSNYSCSIQLPKGLLSNFKKLQVLHLLGKVVLPETFVEEIESLNHLNDLRIQLSTHDDVLLESNDDVLSESSADVLPESNADDVLLESNADDVLPESSDDVLLSRFSSSHKLATITTYLWVRNLTFSTNLDLLVSQKMVNLKLLHIEGCFELEYVISSEIRNYNYMNNLRTLSISSCHKLKDITLLVFTSAPNLESIVVGDCSGMKELCGEWKWEEEHTTPFPKLKTLKLYKLPVVKEHTTPFPKLKTLNLRYLLELERIYPTALPALFPCLKELTIRNCPKLKKLPFNSTSCNSGSGVIIQCQDEWWKQLEWEDDATRIAFLNSHCNPWEYSV